MSGLIHEFEIAGLGKAPFRFLYVASLPSPTLAEQNPQSYQNAMRDLPRGIALGCCSYCGHDLVHNFIVRSSDGKDFAVGSECIEKVGDKGLITAVRLHERQVRQEKRRAKEAKEQEARRAAWEENREVREAEEAAALAALTQENMRTRKINEYAIRVLRDSYQSSFVQNLLSELQGKEDSNPMYQRRARLVTDYPQKLKLILCDMAGKLQGRRGSKFYEDEYNAMEKYLEASRS